MTAIALDTTYEDVRRLVHWTVNRFVSRYGGDVEDATSLASEYFMSAYERWDPTMGTSFSGYVKFRIWSGLLDHRRAELTRLRKRQEVDMERCEARRVGSGLEWWLEELSADARAVVALVFEDSPASRLAEAKGGSPRNWLSSLRAYMLGRGWGRDRVNSVFEELADAVRLLGA